MSFEALLARDGQLVYKTKGTSMEPMLHQNRDLVIIQIPASRLRKYDVALYKRRDKYILHRIVAVKEDHYLTRGDNTYKLEKVPDSAVLGVMTGFRRKNREHAATERTYRLYACVWNALFPLRLAIFYVRRSAVYIARRLGILPLIKRLVRHE